MNNAELAAHREEQRKVMNRCRNITKEFLNRIPLPPKKEIQELLERAKMLGLTEEPWVRVVATDILSAAS